MKHPPTVQDRRPVEHYDVAVIGGGIAGVSIAHELATDRSVCLLEAERELATHTTGRSAATWVAGYGPPVVQELTLASRPFLDDPPLDVDGPLARPLPCLYLGTARTPDAEDAAARVVAATGAAMLTPEEAERLTPVLRPGLVTTAVLDQTSAELDVHGLHQGYVRGLRARGGVVRRSARLLGASRQDSRWRLTTSEGELSAAVVVNAAGAWGDEVGGAFGSAGHALEPRRRSIFVSPTGAALEGLPFTCDLAGEWYFKAEGDAVLCSPEDATSHVPGDPRPDDLEIARALDDINEMTTLGLRSVRTSWAGLRTFAPHGEPVAAWDDEVEGLFWLVGLGGYGIQVAPALAARAAGLVRVGS